VKFTPTPIPGAFVVELQPVADERGFFARSWCAEEFAAHGLNARLVQCNVSFNKRRGTLRGLHYQVKPHEEAKLIRCTAGAVFDVLVDMRPASPAFRRWFAAELSGANRRMLYCPEGVAHGFQTLTDDAELSYQMSESYNSTSERGVRWNDPAFGIVWPIDKPTLSPRDSVYPDFLANT